MLMLPLSATAAALSLALVHEEHPRGGQTRKGERTRDALHVRFDGQERLDERRVRRSVDGSRERARIVGRDDARAARRRDRVVLRRVWVQRLEDPPVYQHPPDRKAVRVALGRRERARQLGRERRRNAKNRRRSSVRGRRRRRRSAARAVLAGAVALAGAATACENGREVEATVAKREAGFARRERRVRPASARKRLEHVGTHESLVPLLPRVVARHDRRDLLRRYSLDHLLPLVNRQSGRDLRHELAVQREALFGDERPAVREGTGAGAGQRERARARMQCLEVLEGVERMFHGKLGGWIRRRVIHGRRR